MNVHIQDSKCICCSRDSEPDSDFCAKCIRFGHEPVIDLRLEGSQSQDNGQNTSQDGGQKNTSMDIDTILLNLYNIGRHEEAGGLTDREAALNEAKAQLEAHIAQRCREARIDELERIKTGVKTVAQYAEPDFEDLITYVFSAEEIEDRISQLHKEGREDER